MEMKKEFGLRVKKIRENMHMTKEEFAKLLGISGQFLGLVEHGKNYLSIENLKKLCEITNFSADYLLFGKNTNLIDETQKVLSDFSEKEIESGCYTLQKLAILLKDLKNKSEY